MDIMSPEQRSRCMAAVKGKNTKPELIVRRYLFSRALRFRLHDRKMPGSPDVVLPKYRTVVFINGCFWYGHEGCKYFRLPKTNSEFWESKISRNVSRDSEVVNKLEKLGWTVIRIWECELKNKHNQGAILQELYENITGTDYNRDMAAEPEAHYGIGKSSKEH